MNSPEINKKIKDLASSIFPEIVLSEILIALKELSFMFGVHVVEFEILHCCRVTAI